ncbi:hypothetical protein T265_08670 [Opisthorchis viverrini]|uniref:Uncharacterized protein n=1 Tax=Opisthorchis viverrini TaxID=6198 RepID=A0A075A7K6_OPIVI|nr:hypothetical protein T265_08670 [Opisthorchis viverrini]KER23449.1 hypothetical protein T265_08670 [Opisthorchis viverrini]
MVKDSTKEMHAPDTGHRLGKCGHCEMRTKIHTTTEAVEIGEHPSVKRVEYAELAGVWRAVSDEPKWHEAVCSNRQKSLGLKVAENPSTAHDRFRPSWSSTAVQRSEHQLRVDVFTCREMSIPMKSEYPD